MALLGGWALQLPVWESAARASGVYLAAVALMRVIPKRQAGGLSPQDFVSAVVVGGLAVEGVAAQADAGPGDYVLMIAVVLGLNLLLGWLADKSTLARRLIREAPTELIRGGVVDRRALRREMITDDELMAQLRKQGVDDPSQVRSAHLEADGQVSVVRADGGAGGGGGGDTRPPAAG